MKQFLIIVILLAAIILTPITNTSAQNITITSTSVSSDLNSQSSVEINTSQSLSSLSSISSSLQNAKQPIVQTQFNKNNIIDDSNIYGLSAKFDSADKIREYLKKQGSFLADYKVDIGFEADDDLWSTSSVKQNIGQYAGKQMDFADFIWAMSQTQMGNSCSFINKNVCIDQKVRPINPALLLALIQRESGLVRGKNAKLDPNSSTAKFLIDRSMAYMCNDSDNDAKSCYDQNPDWKYFKGMFRQVYYGMRLLLINSRRCELGTYKNYRVGNTVSLDGESIKLENGFTCSSYIYTPHVLSQKALYKVYKDIVA
jgi:hypothetical protein